MASLKEVRTRIASVNNTRKITSAMKLVASSKLHRAQQAIEHMLPYEHELEHITSSFVSVLGDGFSSPYALQRKVNCVLLVVFSSNSSLCGAFNTNVIKHLKESVASLQAQGITQISVLPVGRKVADAAKKMPVQIVNTLHADMLDKPTYAVAEAISEGLMQDFLIGKYDQVDMIYNHFKSAGSQTLQHDTLLPLQLTSLSTPDGTVQPDYIVEPSVEELVQDLIPQTLHLKLFTAVLDSVASEHASRVIAMQVATDNANEMLQDLTLMYNKSRQQAITTELLDIAGGAVR